MDQHGADTARLSARTVQLVWQAHGNAPRIGHALGQHVAACRQCAVTTLRCLTDSAPYMQFITTLHMCDDDTTLWLSQAQKQCTPHCKRQTSPQPTYVGAQCMPQGHVHTSLMPAACRCTLQCAGLKLLTLCHPFVQLHTHPGRHTQGMRKTGAETAGWLERNTGAYSCQDECSAQATDAPELSLHSHNGAFSVLPPTHSLTNAGPGPHRHCRADITSPTTTRCCCLLLLVACCCCCCSRCSLLCRRHPGS